jgi:hypothetical protein
MDNRKSLEWLLAGLVAAFALAGCGQANARNAKSDQPASPTVAALSITNERPGTDAEADNGPGCAESALAPEPHHPQSNAPKKK